MKKTTKKIEESLNNEDLRKILLELHDTHYWQAIKQYNLGRLNFADAALRTIDPAKDITQITRMQGVINGIFDLQNYVDMEKKKIIEKNKKMEESRK